MRDIQTPNFLQAKLVFVLAVYLGFSRPAIVYPVAHVLQVGPPGPELPMSSVAQRR